MADCIGTGFPQFPYVFVEIRYIIRENGAAVTFSSHTSSGKEVKERGNDRKDEKGKRGGDCIRQSPYRQ